jgi:type IV secretion system protein VirB1
MSALTTAAVLTLLAQPACFAGNAVPGLREHVLATLTTESGHDPLAINVNGPNGGDRHPATKDEAIALAKSLLAHGKNIDLGLMQINSTNLVAHGLTVETAFDACQNLRAGSEHLAADYRAA